MTDTSIDQILREWPPGYGGVERVANELVCACGGAIYSLNAQLRALSDSDVVPLG